MYLPKVIFIICMSKKIISIFIILIMLISLLGIFSYATTPVENYHDIEALSIPEKDINFQANNLTRGCKVYLLFPVELLKYNMDKFIQNNIDNEFETEQEIAEELKKFLEKNDYIGYLEFFSNEKYGVADNEIEFRQYCVALGTSKIIDYYDYNEQKYVKIELNMNSNNQFKVILKDYFMDTDCSGIIFLIDEFNTLKYINVSDYELTTNPEKSSVHEYNVTLDYVTKEDYEGIEKSIRNAYIALWIIVSITIFIIIKHENKKRIQRKEELKEAWFYKHDEKKSFRERLKEKKEEKKNKKKKR